MYQRYFSRGSGASMGGPSPPPGRASRPAAAGPLSPAGGPPSLLSSRASLSVPVPEILNANAWPALVFEATCTVALGSLGLARDSNPLSGLAENCMVLGNITTKCCAG